MTGAYGSLVRIALAKTKQHPEITQRSQYAESAMLDCLIALCKRLGVPEDAIPAPMTPLGDGWLGDICSLVEIDAAAKKKEDDDAP